MRSTRVSPVIAAPPARVYAALVDAGQISRWKFPDDMTYHGYFKELVPNRRVVEVIEFETSDPAMRGEMTTTVELLDVSGATQLTALHEGLPPAVSPAENEIGWNMALEKLARLVGSSKSQG
jgi:uncharacterized protein YndB with AHSA1/START domain